MSRPSILYIGGTLYWVIRLYDSDGALIDADSSPTVAIRKNGASTADAVTVTKRSATTGIYDCSYNPASEAEGDQFTVEESAVISSSTYTNSWGFTVRAVERGTDNAATAGAQMDLVDAPNEAARLAFSVTAVTENTGETSAAPGSQAKLSQGSGGGGSTPISPIQSTLKNGVLVKSGPIDLLYKEGRTVKIACVDTTNTPIDLTGISVEFVAETRDRAQLFLIETADITLENGEEDVLNTVVIDFTATHASHRGLDHKYAVRRVGDPNTVYATEKLRVEHVPINGG